MKLSLTGSLLSLWMLCGLVPAARAQDYGAVSGDGSLWTERESGFRIGADALIWTRSNSGGGGRIIGGPQGFDFDNIDYDAAGGYRINLAWMIDPNYEVEAVWTQFGEWNGNDSGILTRAVSFDGGEGSVIVDPTRNASFINRGTYFRPLFDAATDPLGATVNDETTEFEFLRSGSRYTLRQTSGLDDGQLNFKTRRTQGRRFNFGLGYRYLRLNESAVAAISGTFDAFDVDGDEAGVNGPNDQLSDEALTAHGLTRISGGGGFNDPDSGGGVMTLLWDGSTANKLNGLQGVIDGTIIERGRFSLDGSFRSGLFYNHITASVVEGYSDTVGSVYGRTFSDEKDTVAFAANFGVTAVVRLAERARLRAGYEFMWLTNVALASSQQQGIQYDALGRASYSVEDGDSVFLQGLKAGVEFEW